MISEITTPTLFESSVYFHGTGVNGLLAVSTMSWLPDQVTFTTPCAGCAKVNAYGPAPEPVRPIAAEELISKSLAFTPVTGSLNVIEIEASAEIVEFGTGSIA